MSPLPAPPPAPSSAAPRPGEARRNPPISRIWWAVGPVSILLAGTLIFLLARPVPYVMFSPGSSRSVEPLIAIEPADGEPAPVLDEPGGTISFVTVSVTYPNGFYLLSKVRDRHVDIAPEALYLGNQSQEQNRLYNEALMTSSKDKAVKVALETSGYEVIVDEGGALIVDIDPTYPAADVLVPGDTIIEADGEPVTTADDLVAAIARHEPEERIALRLVRMGETEERSVLATLARNPREPEKAQLGVSVETRSTFDFPLEVSIDSGETGGPSAGLAFTLALIDLLTPGALTGDQEVAVTGTIELDGTVGDVGGVRQKVQAAISDGATLFLVPPGEHDEALDAASGRMDVVAVSTIGEALDALEARGGVPVEPVEAK